jgi:hypothetical protein
MQHPRKGGMFSTPSSSSQLLAALNKFACIGLSAPLAMTPRRVEKSEGEIFSGTVWLYMTLMASRTSRTLVVCRTRHCDCIWAKPRNAFARYDVPTCYVPALKRVIRWS